MTPEKKASNKASNKADAKTSSMNIESSTNIGAINIKEPESNKNNLAIQNTDYNMSFDSQSNGDTLKNSEIKKNLNKQNY